MASPRLRRTSSRRGRGLRRAGASASPLRVAAGHATIRPHARGALSHSAGRLRRPGRSRRRSGAIGSLFYEARPHKHPRRKDAMTVDTDRAEGSRADVPVLIVGAGPTGLVLALWLTKFGVSVRVIDKTAEAGTTSRAVAVQARTLELYRQVGLSDTVVEAGVKVPGVNLWVRGGRAARVPPKFRGGIESLSLCVDLPAGRPRAIVDRTAGRPWGEGRTPDGVGPLRSASRKRAGGAQAAGRFGGGLRGGLSRRLRRRAFDREGDASDGLSRRDLFRTVLRRRRGRGRPGRRR